MSRFKHSTVLFTDDNCHPMKFFMRPCAEKQRLHPLVEHGGGVLSSKWSNGMYRLIEPGSKIVNKYDNCLSSQFILDCVERNCLQDMEKYKIKVETEEVSDISDNETSKYTIRTTRRSTRGRQEYTDADDYIILNYIIKSRRYDEVKGRRIWINLQNRKVLPNRTWQSLKERYIKKILPHIYKYDISGKHKKLLANPFNLNDVSDTSNESDNPYTVSDDLQILGSLFEDSRLQKVNEDILWKEIEDISSSNHSWKSLKDRFFNKIIPTLNRYNLSLQQLRELSKAVEIPALVLLSARNNAGKQVSNTVAEKPQTLISESESYAYKNCLRTKQKSVMNQSAVLDKDEMCKTGKDESISECSSELKVKKGKRRIFQLDAISDSSQSSCKNDRHTNGVPCPQMLKSSSFVDDSDVSDFEYNSVTQYNFQHRLPKVPIKKLSMNAIQQHVAEEIQESPSKKPEIDNSEKHALNSLKIQNQLNTTSSVVLSSNEILDSESLVTTKNIIDALDGEWPETADKNILALSCDEISDDSSSTTIVNVNSLKKTKSSTLETSTVEKSLHQRNVGLPIQSKSCVKNTTSKECSNTATNSILTRNTTDNGIVSDICETPNKSKQDVTDTSDEQPQKYRRLKGGKKLIKKNVAQHHSLDINKNHNIASGTATVRKRIIDGITTDGSDVITTEDQTLSSTLNIALKHIKNIKETCENWCGSSNRAHVSVPVNSLNRVQKELDELQAIMYKTQLILLSNEITKKSKNDINDDDVLILLKFLIVHGNYSMEDAINTITNKISCR